MQLLFKIAPIFSLALVNFLPWTLAQAQAPSQTCQTLLNNERSYVNWYPVTPLPETVATDAVARQLSELEAIATSPSSLDLAIQENLILWLTEKPDPGPPDTGRAARMDLLLKVLPNSQKPQLIALIDQLALRIEKLPSLSLRAEMTGKLAGYYQRLQGNDRAALLLNRGIALALKSTDEQSAVQLTKLVDAVVELGLSKAIAPQLPKIETVLNRSTPTLSLARLYADNNQSQKALLLADRIAKATPTTQVISSDLITLYLQLNRLDKANFYLKRVSPDYDDAPYGRLVAAYDRAKQPKEADKLFKAGFDSWRRAFYNVNFLNSYLKAGGNPDRLFTGLPTFEGVGAIDLRLNYALRAAGEYRRRNQPQKVTNAIAEFVQAVAPENVNIDSILMAAISDGNRLEAKTAFEQLLARNAFTKIEPPINFAAQINALDNIAPFVQRLSKNPERRIELLQSLAIAYAKQQQLDKAVSIAEKIPRRSPEYSSAIDTLAQVAAVFAKSGQPTKAKIVFAKASSLASTVKGFDTRAIAYAAIARAYTTANDTASAQTARQTAVKWASSLPTDDNLGVTAKYTLSLISQQFLDANQVEAAWKTLQEISPYGYKDINIGNLVSTALALGNLPIAQQAIDLQYSNGTPESFLDQAPQLAKAYLDRNRSEEALKILDLAANLLNNQNNKYPTYVMPIVQLYAKAGRIDAARQVIAKLPNPIPTNDASWRQELQQYVNCHQKTYS